MTSASSKSLDHLEREAERNRAVLVETVDALRASVLDDVASLRRKASLDYVGAEIRERVRANPLRSFAIGAGLTLPLWKMGHRVSMPLLLIGAGVATARPAAKNALAGAASDASDRVRRAGTRSNDALDRIWGAGTEAGQQVAAGLDAAHTTLRAAKNDAATRLGDAVDASSEAASNLAGKGAAILQSGSEQLADARDHAGQSVARTRARAMDLFHDNPLLVAGAGLALGALLAAIVPATESEGKLVGKVAPDLKRKASDLVDEGYETVRAAAGDAYDGAVGRAEDQGLSPEGARNAASDLGERLGAVVDAAVGQHEAGHSNDAEAHS